MLKLFNLYLVSEYEMDEIQRDIDRLYTYKLLNEMKQEESHHEENNPADL